MDQGRDMLDIRNIVIGKHPTLIGPTTSINGVFLGPFWYYFNVIPFIFGKGDPTFLVYWLIIWYQLTGLLIWLFFKKTGYLLALFSSTLFLMSPSLFEMSSFSWSANPAPIFITFFFLAFFSFLNSPSVKKAFLLGVVSGLPLQIEAALGVLLIPFTVIYFLSQKSPIKYLSLILIGFGITLLPQIIFELKHSFVMTNTLLNEFNGQTAILGPRLNFFQTATSHFNSFSQLAEGLVNLPVQTTQSALIISLLVFTWQIKKKMGDAPIKKILFPTVSFIFFAFLSYLLFPHPLKDWYLKGLYIPYLIILAFLLTKLVKLKKLIICGLVFISLAISFYNTAHSQVRVAIDNFTKTSADQSNLKNELQVIDWVYQKAGGQGFKAFNYIPSVYDYPYQYLFWWYGTKKYGYQPDQISYMENVPEYIINNSSYWTQRKFTEDKSPIFLIMEQDKDRAERLISWQENFSHLCLKDRKTFSFKTEVQLRYNCAN